MSSYTNRFPLPLPFTPATYAPCAPCCRQITLPAPHHSNFYRPDALPDAQPTVSKHRKHYIKQLRERLFSSKVTVQAYKQTHTHTGSTAGCGPLQWSVTKQALCRPSAAMLSEQCVVRRAVQPRSSDPAPTTTETSLYSSV